MAVLPSWLAGGHLWHAGEDTARIDARAENRLNPSPHMISVARPGRQETPKHLIVGSLTVLCRGGDRPQPNRTNKSGPNAPAKSAAPRA